MANLLSLLNTGLGATANLQNAALEGREVGRQRKDAGLLAQLKAAQEAEDRALRQRLTEAQITNYGDLARERQEPKAVTPQFVPDLGGYVHPDTNTFTPVQGIPKPTSKPYEERQEKGGVAIYEDGKFKSWKIRPPQERDATVADALAANRQFQREQALRQDYQQEPVVKQAGALASAVAQLRASAAEKTPQGDLNMLYGAVKLRDPNAVREGELALNNKARSAHTQLFALWDRVQSGRILTDAERAQIMSLVEQMVEQQSNLVRPVQKLFGEKSRQYGADSAFVARDPFEGVRSAPNLAAKYGLEVKP